jgi:hypothetical protein
MDLTKLSTADLQAMQAGDLTKVSTEGLRMLQGKGGAETSAPTQMTRADFLKRELLRSPPVALARGVKDIIDTGAGFLSRLGGKEEAARVAEMNAAGRAEFDKAVEGQVLPQVARAQGNLSATMPAVRAIGGAVGTVLPKLGAAIGSGGAVGGNIATRTAGGAIAGGASAGMVNPEDAALGAALGGAAPVVLKAAGAAGQGVGRLMRGPEQAPQMAQALQSAQELGLVVPPTQARASLPNRLIEGVAGKITTAQNASAKNAPKINQAAARSLGLPEDTQLTPEVIGYVKKAAGTLYDAVGSAGQVTPGAAFAKALDDIAAPHLQAAKGFPNAKPSPVIQMVDSLRSESFDAAAAVSKIKELRSAADDAFKPGGAGADIGRAAKKAASALEGALDDHLKSIGEPDLLNQFRAARQLYAKASDVGQALNQASGNVDARKLAAKLQKGKPLSGELKQVAEFAAQFPKAAQPLEGMGSLPQLSPLDWFAGGGLGFATGNPLALLTVGARPAARAAALSPMVQNRLIQGAPASGQGAYELLTMGARAAPTIAAAR